PDRLSSIAVDMDAIGSVTGWHLSVSAPGHVVPALGRYEGAVRSSFLGTEPELDFSGEGRACGRIAGRFDLLELGYGADGTLDRRAVNFEQRCDADPQPLRGQVRVNSRVPLDGNVVGRPKADFAGEGRSDILWRNAVSGENYLYPMNGTAIEVGEGFLRTV